MKYVGDYIVRTIHLQVIAPPVNRKRVDQDSQIASD
jgi:hypothetical protein